jgi:hypothetical protein
LHEAEPRDGAECCLSIASQTGYVPVMVDPESIYHWHRLDDRITTSGQPSETQLADIAALGVRCLPCRRGEDAYLAGEPADDARLSHRR